MTHYESQLKWDPRTKTPVVYSLLPWEQQYLHPLSSVILFTPKLTDLPRLDRINKEYTQWIML